MKIFQKVSWICFCCSLHDESQCGFFGPHSLSLYRQKKRSDHSFKYLLLFSAEEKRIQVWNDMWVHELHNIVQNLMIHEERVLFHMVFCYVTRFPSSIYKWQKYWLEQGKIKNHQEGQINNEHGSLRVNHRSSTEPKQPPRANIILLSWVTEDHGYHSHNLHEYLFSLWPHAEKDYF